MDKPLQAIQDNLRIPFYQTENSNDDLSDNLAQDQYFQNLIPQFSYDSEGNKEEFLVKRPGLQVLPSSDFMTGIVNDPTSCSIMDVIPITALYDVYVAAVYDTSDGSMYIIMIRPANGVYVKIGAFSSGSTMGIDDYCFLTEYTQSNAGSTYPAVAVSYTNNALTLSVGYYARSSGGVFGLNTLTQITDTNFPPEQTPALITMGRFVYMNGTIYIATLDGRICNSASTNNDITTWSDSFGPGVISANAYADQLIGLCRYKHHIVAFGRNTVQFFDDVGNDPCPLQATQQAFIKFGAKSPRLIRNVNDILYWVAYGEAGVNGLWMLDGYTPTKLSTPAIDTMLVNTAAAGDPAYTNMQFTSINNRPQLIINNLPGPPALLPLYSPTMPTASGIAPDTHPLSRSNDFTPSTLCYNIVDKTWWLFHSRVNRLGLICAGTEFATPSIQTNMNYYSQLLLVQITPVTGSKFSNNYVYQWCNLLDVNEDDVGDPTDASYPNYPITTVATTNTFWFDNERRKRVNKIKIIGYIPANSLDTDVYSMYIFFLKDQAQINTSIQMPNMQVRGFNFPNSFYRYYLNSLGSGRAWTFCVVEKSKLPVKYKALELDIRQGSN